MHSFTGVVKEGSKRGAVLGFPTANIAMNDPKITGIYVAELSDGSITYSAAAYVDTKRNILEAHLLDYFGSLYGRTVTITLLHKIRESSAFDDEEKLRAAIEKDVKKVREYFNTT